MATRVRLASQERLRRVLSHPFRRKQAVADSSAHESREHRAGSVACRLVLCRQGAVPVDAREMPENTCIPDQKNGWANARLLLSRNCAWRSAAGASRPSLILIAS